MQISIVLSGLRLQGAGELSGRSRQIRKASLGGRCRTRGREAFGERRGAWDVRQIDDTSTQDVNYV